MSQYLFSTIGELKEYIPVAYTNLGIGDEKPFILLAQETYLKDILGADLYSQLLDYADPSSSSGSGSGSGSGNPPNLVSNANLERLLVRVRPAVAMFAYYEGLPFMEIKISKTGIHQVVGDELQPIFSTQRERLETTLLKLGYNQLESILLWLEANQSDFTVWTTSDAYTNFKGNFIESATTFTQYWSKLNSSRQTYVALKSIMREVDQQNIRDILGDVLWSNVKSALANGTADTTYSDILAYARPLMAYLTAAKAMPALTLAIEAYGIFTPTVAKNDKNVKVFSEANANRFSQERDRLFDQANNYAVRFKKFLNDNIDSYPDFEASQAYDSSNTTIDGTIPDQDENGIIGMF